MWPPHVGRTMILSLKAHSWVQLWSRFRDWALLPRLGATISLSDWTMILGPTTQWYPQVLFSRKSSLEKFLKVSFMEKKPKRLLRTSGNEPSGWRYRRNSTSNSQLGENFGTSHFSNTSSGHSPPQSSSIWGAYVTQPRTSQNDTSFR